MPDYSGHKTHDEFAREQMLIVLSLCEAILSGEISAVKGCLMLVPHGRMAGLDRDDEDFSTLYWIDDACSEMPSDSQRHLFADELLKAHDEEKDRIEQLRKADILKACEGIHDRFEHLISSDED
jgi:hypothetical protein